MSRPNIVPVLVLVLTFSYGWIELNSLVRLATLGVGGFGRVDLVSINSPRDGQQHSFALKTMRKRQSEFFP